ncbi:TFP11-domain-containing protein [Sodiomyces alkalinus F11]|uniref:TFP11-domain-containing protein n=1 Tax=Sodiomyces alkalinus (strain CBS 110278 / VKM F-3762 / F11) TaxID=1314773 RepID=A0A3N2PVC6_SODAK|nr:TFP11-domain-containing protein [Sodiomyces alkalinus F11]ROT38296.1 TFP11-domain-containing protein [Sodiomyces alkalinus F11]
MSEYPKFDPSRLTKSFAAAQYSSESEEEEDDDFTIPQVDPSAGDDFRDSNPRKRRRVGNAKERAALGIFASDSEDDGPGRRWKSRTLRGKGMNFVSTGSASNGQPEEEAKEYSDEEGDANINAVDGESESDEEDEEDEEEDRGVGLGFRSTHAARAGQAFVAAQNNDNNNTGGGTSESQTTRQRPSFPKTKFDGKSALGRGFVPSSAYQPVLKESVDDDDASPNPQVARPSAFAPAKGNKTKINPQSFGARMMAKMGYVEGRGLGKEGQGRNVIIEAHLRPQGVGLGAVREKSEAEKKEEKRQARLRGETVIDSDEEEKQRKRERKKKAASGSGATSGTGTPSARHKTTFMTAEELRKTAPGLQIPEAFAPILDMTGPGNKLLTSTSGLLTPTSGAVPESSEVAEARKLARRAHADLAAFSEEWRNLEDRKSWIDHELREREKEEADLTSAFGQLQLFANVVTNELPHAIEWSDVMRCLQQALEHIVSPSAEVADIAVADIVVAAIHPFFRDPDWTLLEEPARFATELKDLRSLLMKPGEGDHNTNNNNGGAVGKWDPSTSGGLNSTDIYRRHHKATTAYETMMYKLWFPKAMTAIRAWDVFDPGALLAVLEAWDDLLPGFVRAQFVDGVVRKLEAAVGEWNPRKSKTKNNDNNKRHQQGQSQGQGQSQRRLPHLWLFPWLPYLPAYHLEPKGTGLVADVRRKFGQLIDVWEFERGVVPGLEQWRDVLGTQWRPLVMGHVLPGMGRYLKEHFRIDPSDQEPYLPILTGALKWTGVLGSKVLAEVMVAEVFPLWHDKLSEWLGLEEMNLEEVYAWYEWWRDQVFPKEVSGATSVKREFEKGSMTIAAALENM